MKNRKNIWSPSTEPHVDGRPTYNAVWPGSPSSKSLLPVLTFLGISMEKCHLMLVHMIQEKGTDIMYMC